MGKAEPPGSGLGMRGRPSLSVWCLALTCVVATTTARASGPEIAPGPEITLGEALRAAEGRNPTLKALKVELDRADGQLAGAWSLISPVVNAGLQYIRADHEDTVDMTEGLAETFGPMFEDMGLEMPQMESEPVVIRRLDDLKGTLTAALPLINPQSWFTISAAVKGRDIAELSIADAAQEFLLGVARAYYLALMSRAMVDMYASQIESTEKHLDFAQKRLASGAGLKIDVVRAATDLVAARQQSLNAHLSLETARDVLGVLTGLGELPMPVGVPDLPEPEDEEEDMIRQAMGVRLDVRIADENLSLAKRRHAGSIASFMPTADMAWQGNYQFTEPSSFGSLDRSRWNLIFNVNVPIFQFFKVGELWEKEAAVRIAELKELDVRQQASREVRQARRDYRTAVSTNLIATQQVKLAKEALSLAGTAYKAGVGSSLEVTDARRTFSAAEVNRATTRLKAQIALLVLHRALGNDIMDLVR